VEAITDAVTNLLKAFFCSILYQLIAKIRPADLQASRPSSNPGAKQKFARGCLGMPMRGQPSGPRCGPVSILWSDTGPQTPISGQESDRLPQSPLKRPANANYRQFY
jgi:hypothetical protein